MTGAEFYDWLHKQEKVDFQCYGVPIPGQPGRVSEITEMKIIGDNDSVILSFPIRKPKEKSKLFVNAISAILAVNRIMEDCRTDTTFSYESKDKDGGVMRALGGYCDVFYGDDE